jgi:hypothetical protein
MGPGVSQGEKRAGLRKVLWMKSSYMGAQELGPRGLAAGL